MRLADKIKELKEERREKARARDEALNAQFQSELEIEVMMLDNRIRRLEAALEEEEGGRRRA